MKLIYLPFIIFSILSCKNQSTTQIEKLHIDNIIQIKGETISQIPAGCYTAGIIKDTFLCLQNTCSEKQFQIFSNNSKNMLYEFGATGRGPNEYQFPLIIKSDTNTSSLLIHDLVQNRLTRFYLKNDTSIHNTILPPELANSQNLNIIDSTIVRSPIGEDSILFYLYDKHAKIIKKIDYEPQFYVSRRGNKSDAYSHILSVNSQHNSIIAAFKYINLINFYHTDGSLQKSLSLDLVNDEVDYSEFQLSEDMLVTSYQIYSTSNFCYLLWSGLSANNGYDRPPYLLVFTWNGILEKVYQFDSFVNFIIVDEANRQFLGGVDSPKSELVEIKRFNY